MAQIHTLDVPEKNRVIFLAPRVKGNREDRIGWYGWALERYSNGDVLVEWSEYDLEDQDDAIADLGSEFPWRPTERVKFDDLTWCEGIPKGEE